MRARNADDDLSVHAVAGTHVVLLGLDLRGRARPGAAPSPRDLCSGLAGLALEREREERPPAFVGFAIDRRDVAANTSITLNGGGPVQKFHFGDYTALPGRQYEYAVRRVVASRPAPTTAVTATAKAAGAATRAAPAAARPACEAVGPPVVVRVTTEDPDAGPHGVYFNRGCAGSRAYAEKFGKFRKEHRVTKFGAPRWTSIINPREIPDPDAARAARAWLSRGLEEALLRFLAQAEGRGWRLRAAVYEFTHPETIQAFASAVERGVDVKIVRHCKGSYRARVGEDGVAKDDHGKPIKDFVPDAATAEAQQAIDRVGFQSRAHARAWQHDTFLERRHSSGIMHNKFIALVKDDRPVHVWTGSTNPTDSGIYGQSNVGHVVRDGKVAGQYLEYWQHLSKDAPGRKPSRKTAHGDGREEDGGPMDDWIEERQADLEGDVATPSTHVIFSPRKTDGMLRWYADRLAGAARSVHYTAAFGIATPLAVALRRGRGDPGAGDGLRRSPRLAARRGGGEETTGPPGFLRYVLLDRRPSARSSRKKRDAAERKGREYLDYYDLKDVPENRIGFGATLPAGGEGDAMGEALTGLTSFVDYVHTKYMIIDALTDDPLVVTGSANFSVASTDKNDENSLVIRGDTGVADVYFTEFMRLFDHFYSRDKFVAKKSSTGKGDQAWGEAVMDQSWLRPYFDVSSQLYQERLILR